MRLYALVHVLAAFILLTACNDDTFTDKPVPGEDAIDYATSIFNELPTKSRGKNTPRYSSFKAEKMDNSDIYLLTTVEDKIELPTKTDTVKSRGAIIDSNTFGTSGYNNMQIYAYAYKAADYADFDEAHEAEGLTQYINAGTLNISKKDGELNATPDQIYHWTQSRYKLTFFGIFPSSDSPSYELLAHSVTDGWPTINYHVPTDINDQQDIMYAKSDEYIGDGKGCGYTVELPLKHALTAVSVELSTGFESRIIKSVTFSGLHCYSHYSLGDSDGWQHEATSTLEDRSATFTNADAVTNLYESGNVFMMVPQTLEDGATITVTVENTLTGKEKTFTASISGTWEMGQTVRYKLSTTAEDVEYFFETQRSTMYYSYDNTAAGEGEATASDVTYTSPYNDEYAYLRLRSYKATTKVVNGAVQTTYAKLGWNASVTSGSDIAYISPTDETFAQQIAGDETSWTNWTYRVYPRFSKVNAGYTRKSEENEKLATNASTKTLGSAASPIDLSKYYPDGTYRGDSYRNSSNCYIVNYPGYYEIPVVCGSALYNNSTGTNMFSNLGSDANAMKTLKNYLNEDIANEWINYARGGYDYVPAADGGSTKDTYIEWQDIDGLVTPTYDYTRKVAAAWYNSGHDEFYIRFYVSKENFTQGNAVIAVKNSSGYGSLILWSYHIWVTPYTKDDTFTAQSNQGENQTFLKVPLGFVADDIKCYDAREAEITFTQKESGKTATVKLVQEYHEFQARSATYYQWGRKDPFPGALVAETGKLSSDLVYETTVGEKTIYSTDGKTGVTHTSSSGITGPGLGIQNPLTFYYGHMFPDRSYYDLWGCTVNSSSNTEYPGSVTAGLSSRKTVYDPSPAGFKVPPFYAMPAITTDGLIQKRPNYTSYDVINASEESIKNLSKNGYIDFYKNKSSKTGETYRLYALGSRLSTNSAGTDGGFIENVGNDGCYWSCTRWVSAYNTYTSNRMFALRYSNLDFYSPWSNTDTYGYCVLPMVGDI